MTLAIFRAALLGFLRDRGALALAFLLPPLIYVIFAIAFSPAAGGDLRVDLAVLAGDDAMSRRLVEKLAGAAEVSALVEVDDEVALHRAIAAGRADAGLEIIRVKGEAPSFRIHEDRTRQAASLATEKALSRLAPTDTRGAQLDRTAVNPVNAGAPMAAYFAAGVTLLFLMLSGFQSALTLVEERDAGVVARIAASGGGAGPVIDGKFLFITLQGAAQAALIFATAALLFRIDLAFAPALLIATTLAAAAAAAGLALAVTALARSRMQAHAAGTTIALLFAAVGGSMAPAFLMPEAVQAAGRYTLNGLGVAAYGPALWSGGGAATALPAIAALGVYAAAGWAVARLAIARSVRLD